MHWNSWKKAEIEADSSVVRPTFTNVYFLLLKWKYFSLHTQSKQLTVTSRNSADYYTNKDKELISRIMRTEYDYNKIEKISQNLKKKKIQHISMNEIFWNIVQKWEIRWKMLKLFEILRNHKIKIFIKFYDILSMYFVSD